MKSDEFKIILEDINEKFDVLVEGHKSLKERLDRDREENRKEHEDIRSELLLIRKDLNDHRNSTELHVAKKKKKASSHSCLLSGSLLPKKGIHIC